MEWEKNIYYKPGASGLEKVAELETGGSYEFNITLVVKDKNGDLFYAQDSGCSCPTPFENHDLASLVPVTWENFSGFEADVRSFHYESRVEVAKFLDEIETLVRSRG